VDWLLIVVPGVIWGASFLFIAEGLAAVSPNGVTFLRILIGFASLSLVPAARRPILAADRTRAAALGVLWLAFPLSMFPFAEQHVSSALTGMLNGATPIFAAIVAGVVARRLPSPAMVLGLAVGVGGAALMAIPGFGAAAAASGQTAGVLMILAALISYGFAINLAGPLQQRNGALPVIWRAQAVAVLLTAPFGAPAALHGTWSLRPALALLALGALGTCVANLVSATAAGRLGPTRASASTFLMPVVALILGVVVRGERVALISIAGAAVCLIGAALVRRASAHTAIKRAAATATEEAVAVSEAAYSRTTPAR
jgi:drug/metabolite transporter (DMT)-like permease